MLDKNKKEESSAKKPLEALSEEDLDNVNGGWGMNIPQGPPSEKCEKKYNEKICSECPKLISYSLRGKAYVQSGLYFYRDEEHDMCALKYFKDNRGNSNEYEITSGGVH